MRLIGQILRGIALVLCLCGALFYGLTSLAAMVLLARGMAGDEPSLVLGRMLGALFAALVCVAISQRLWRRLFPKR